MLRLRELDGSISTVFVPAGGTPTGKGKVETFNFNASEKQDFTVVFSVFLFFF